MSAGDAAIQWAMLIVGACGGFATMPEAPRWLRIAGVAWIAAWAGPPLLRLWLAGVLA